MALLLLTLSARADDLTEAKRYFEEGRKSYQLGEYAKAIAAHKRSFELSGNAILLFNLGQSYRKLGDNAQALHFYRQFVATDPKGKMREDALEHIERLEALVANADRTKTAPPNGIDGEPEKSPPPVAPVVTPPPQSVVAAPPKKSRAWIWGVTAAGVVVVAGVAIGLGVGLTRGTRYPNPTAGFVDGN